MSESEREKELLTHLSELGCPGASCTVGHGAPTPDASGAPQAPRTAPDSTPRGSADTADGSEALRVALTLFLDCLVNTGAGLVYRPTGESAPDALLPLVLAYGREQATQALEDAADGVTKMDADDGYPLRTRTGTARWLNARADELGRQT